MATKKKTTKTKVTNTIKHFYAVDAERSAQYAITYENNFLEGGTLSECVEVIEGHLKELPDALDQDIYEVTFKKVATATAKRVPMKVVVTKVGS